MITSIVRGRVAVVSSHLLTLELSNMNKQNVLLLGVCKIDHGISDDDGKWDIDQTKTD